MPPTWSNVQLRTASVDRIEAQMEKEYEDQPRKPTIGVHIENRIMPIIKDDEVVPGYGPFLEACSIDQDEILAKANGKRVNGIAELTFTNGTLRCNLDESVVDRVQAGFPLAIPAIYDMLASRVEKTPSVSRRDL